MYWLCILMSAGLALFDIAKYLVPVLLFGQLFLTIAVIPFSLAWSERMFRGLLIQTGVTMAYTVFIYGVLYWKSGLIVAGKVVQVPLWDAVYFSAATWTTLLYGDMLPPPDARVLTIAQGVNAYLAMAVLVSLVVLWMEQALASAQSYVRWLQNPRKSKTASTPARPRRRWMTRSNVQRSTRPVRGRL